ncbi:MAG: isoprenylcysteine carboxylmethyltransferase family protein [Pseudolabrys sp.]|jgi:protein-S-isoprenylcysteine O-methyltransferase Ste14
MDTSYHALLPVTWVCWALYWGFAAIGAKPDARREPRASRLGYNVPIALGVAAMAVPNVLGAELERHFVPATEVWFRVGWGVTLAGMALTVLARMWLGRNWSGTVTLKQDHELIRSGPYAYMRHPIYTGLLLALIGTAIAIDQWQALIGVALVAAALVRKMAIEERFMHEQFGEAYANYRAKVRALVPFVV